MSEQAPTRQVSRQVTEDGRNSLRKHLLGARQGGVGGVLSKNVNKKELYPLFVAVGGACFLAGWFMQRHLFDSPNVHVGKTRNMTMPPPVQHEQAARRFTKHRESMRNLTSHGRDIAEAKGVA